MDLKVISRYLTVWWRLTVNSFSVSLSSRFSAALFLTGKLLQFVFFIVFLLAIFSKTTLIAGYDARQAVFFFLTFNLVDTSTQLFFREVYRFRRLVVTGDFDLILVSPMKPLFRALTGGADPLDLLMLIPYVGLLVYVGGQFPHLTLIRVLAYILLLANGFLIATAFHILVLALAVVTTEIDHAIMIYRDLTSMGRLPVDIYREPLRSVITFVIPVGIMMTFPAKAMLGLLSFPLLVVSLILGMGFFWVCLTLWRWALGGYASASS